MSIVETAYRELRDELLRLGGGSKIILQGVFIYALVGASGKTPEDICLELHLGVDKPNEVARMRMEEFCREHLGL